MSFIRKMKYGQKQGYIFRKKLSTGTQKEQNCTKRSEVHKNPFQGLEGKPVEKQYHAKISQRIA